MPLRQDLIEIAEYAETISPKSSNKTTLSKKVAIVKAPLSLGQGYGSGVDHAPDDLINGGLIDYLTDRLGHSIVSCELYNHNKLDIPELKYNNEALEKIINCKGVYPDLLKLYNHILSVNSPTNRFTVNIGGDHSIAGATLPAFLKLHPKNHKIIWVDAHGDINNLKNSSGNYHGMPVAHALGLFEVCDEDVLAGALDPADICYIGLRDLDDFESNFLSAAHIRAYTMSDVDRLGIGKVMDEILAEFLTDDCVVHLSLDIDAVDPLYAPGTGTRAKGGLTLREIHYICEFLGQNGETNTCLRSRSISNIASKNGGKLPVYRKPFELVSMDLVEVNSDLEETFSPHRLANVSEGLEHGDDPLITATSLTVRLAIELIGSALGKSII